MFMEDSVQRTERLKIKSFKKKIIIMACPELDKFIYDVNK